MSTTLDNRILSKAENLFLRYGIKSVSMDDIARELGISKKTLYRSVEEFWIRRHNGFLFLWKKVRN